MDKTATLQLLRAITFQKTAGGLTAPVAGSSAPRLPTVGEGGTKQDQLLRSAGQNAQAQAETVQNRVTPATSNYSPAKGRNASGPSGIGQSFSTVMAKQPPAKKLVQPPTRAKMAYVKQAAPRRSRAAALLGEGMPPQARVEAPIPSSAVPPAAPPAAPPPAATPPVSPAPSRVRSREVERLPVAPGPWSPGYRIPDSLAGKREAVRRYSPYGPGSMTEREMKAFLRQTAERPSAGARFGAVLGGPFLRYPSPPVYAPPAAGETFANALTQVGTALGLQNKGMFRSTVDFARRLGGGGDAAVGQREILAPAIKPGLLRNAAGEISPVRAALKIGGPLASVAYGGKALYDYATNKKDPSQAPAQAPAGGPVTRTVTPEQARFLDHLEQTTNAYNRGQQLLGIPPANTSNQ